MLAQRDRALPVGNTVQLELKVDGMVCGGCSSRVQEALAKMQHVKQVEVSLDKKMASVEVEAPTLLDAMNMLPKMVETVKVGSCCTTHASSMYHISSMQSAAGTAGC